LLFLAIFIFFNSPAFAENKTVPAKKYSLKQGAAHKASEHKKKSAKKAVHKYSVPRKADVVVDSPAAIKIETEENNLGAKLDGDKILPVQKLEEVNAPVKNNKPISQKLWRGITAENLEALKKISLAIEHKNYGDAFLYAEMMKGKDVAEEAPVNQAVKVKPDFYEAMKNIILWNKFDGKIDEKNISFSDISRFVEDNDFYPNISEMRRNVEKVAVANSIPYQSSELYFKTNPATNIDSKLFFVQSKINFLMRSTASEAEKIAMQKEIQGLISEIWIKENFSTENENAFLTKYQNQLNEIDHINRIEKLLWDSKIEDAKRILHFVNDDYQKLFLAIMEMQNSPKNIDHIISSVPRKLRSNEGLIYREILWYKSKDRADDAIDAMVDLPKKSQFAQKWWSLRRLYAREMIKQKKYKIAYALFASHSLPTTSSDFWEGEWTAGWIALRFMDQPKVAYNHFDLLYKNVSQPVSISRATYWLGMAAQANGDKKKAIDWYKVAAKYSTFFYGQLAIHKHRLLDAAGAQDDIILPQDPEIKVSDMNAVSQSRAAQVAFLLALTGDKANAGKVFEWLVGNLQTEGQVAVVMKLINEIGDRQLDAKISRAAAKKNVFFIKDKFQIVKEVSGDEYAPLVHAIIKQESGFAPTAVSQVGALGFMQLMPATAKLVAKDMGIKYDKHLLSTDIKYNVKLGTHYIKKMIDRFDGSEMMAIASYNAGPNATQRWVNEFYDPRKEKDIDKVIDWIELITYSETRNYVQRIMENLIVYKYLMSRSNYDKID